MRLEDAVRSTDLRCLFDESCNVYPAVQMFEYCKKQQDAAKGKQFSFVCPVSLRTFSVDLDFHRFIVSALVASGDHILAPDVTSIPYR